MSIMAWRIWNICGPVPGVHTCSLDYELRGLYGTKWVPDQVMEAQCNKNCLIGNNICMWKCTTCHQEWMQLHHKIENISCPRCTTPTGIHICERISHCSANVPFSTCTCGIYSNNSFEAICEALGCCTVLGIAEIWGKIIVAEHGYRAQYAMMRALIDQSWGSYHGQARPGLIAKDYQVPLLPSIEYAQREFFS